MEALTGADPQVVGGFRLRARLGAGGMGQVYLATSSGGRMVAVKVIRPELAGDPEFVRRFRAEAEAARLVSGMYTAPVVAAGIDDRPPWLATAFVPGPSLEGIVGRHGPLPVAALWRLAAGLADALRAIHATGLVHRDLKPANVLLALDGPRVIDFGIARADTRSRLTATGSIMGTPQFMSPEQIQGEPAGPPSDVFALGSVLAFAASGASPFDVGPEAVSAAVLYRIVHGTPNLDKVSAQLQELIQACLAKDPAWRPDLGKLAVHCAATAEALGMSPAVFWPPEVAAAIEAQQAATAAQVAELGTSPRPAAGGMAGPAPGPVTWPRAGQPETGPHDHARHGAPTGRATGVFGRRRLLAAGVGGAVAVIGGGATLFGLHLSGTETNNNSGNTINGNVVFPGNGSAASSAGSGGSGAARSAVWMFPTGGLVLANPGAAQGVVYVGNQDKTLYAVDAADGKQLWQSGQGWISAAPQVVGSMLLVSTVEGVFSAIHAATGTVVWQQQTETPSAFRPIWAVNKDTVLLPSPTGPLTLYDVTTGKQASDSGGPSQFGSPGQFSGGAFGVANGVLYALTAEGGLFAVEIATGTVLWKESLTGAKGGFFDSLTATDGALYLTDDSGVLYSLKTSNGHSNWSYASGATKLTPPVAGSAIVYVVDDSGTLHAVSAANGAQLWQGQGLHGGEIGPVLSGSTLYVATGQALQALNAQSGNPLWSFSGQAAGGSPAEASAFASAPAVAGGLVFIGDVNRNLYAIRA